MIAVAIDPSLSNTCLTAFDIGDRIIVIDSVTITTQKNPNKKIPGRPAGWFDQTVKRPYHNDAIEEAERKAAQQEKPTLKKE